MPRTLWAYEDLARVHLSMSGTLLETLSHPTSSARSTASSIAARCSGRCRTPRFSRSSAPATTIPVLALIPEADWDEQIARWQALARHVFWRSHFPGFWPPELGFDERLIPHLTKAGYRYVIVDSEYVDPVGEMSWQELRYRPHICTYDGEEIVVVVRDRDLSNAQLAGMEHGWFMNELSERTKWCDFPPLIVTATDGDNGGWFRNVNPLANFWNYFYQKALDEIRAGNSPMRPIFIDDYLDRFGAHGRVTVRRGAWNTDAHHGWDFHQWQGSQMQRDALARICRLSEEYHGLAARAATTAIRRSGGCSARRNGTCCAARPAATSTGARPGSARRTRTRRRRLAPRPRRAILGTCRRRPAAETHAAPVDERRRRPPRRATPERSGVRA